MWLWDFTSFTLRITIQEPPTPPHPTKLGSWRFHQFGIANARDLYEPPVEEPCFEINWVLMEVDGIAYVMLCMEKKVNFFFSAHTI